MTPQERAVIDGIFEKLRPAASQPRDPEVDRYIADLMRQNPHAAYAMAQSVFVQEQALINQQQQIEQMQGEIAQLQQQSAAPQGGGFLSGIFGGGAKPQPQQMPAYGQRAQPGYGQQGMNQQGMQPQAQAQPQAGPWGQPQQPPQRQGMGFLGTAAAAAAGVAGGMMLGNVLSGAFGGGQAHAAPNANQNTLGQPQSTAQEPSIENSDAGYDDSDIYGGSDDSYDA